MCIAAGIAGFIACFPRPSIVHIGFVAPLVLPLLTYCLCRTVWFWPAKPRIAVMTLLIVLCAQSAYYFSLKAKKSTLIPIASTPQGEMRIPQVTSILISQMDQAPPHYKFFFYPYLPMLPFLTEREHTSRYDIFVPGYSPPAHYFEACVSALQNAHWAIIDTRWSNDAYLKHKFPTHTNPKPNEKIQFEAALNNNFEFVTNIGHFELRKTIKKPNISECDSILN